jgi:N utilization substance protein A
VVVPNDQLSLAIGRQGQNVRLASRLLGWRIDVKSEQRWNNLQDQGYQSILALKGVDESLADQILAKGIHSVVDLAGKSVEELLVIRSLDTEFAGKLIEAAKVAASKFEKTADPISAEEGYDEITETERTEEVAESVAGERDADDDVVGEEPGSADTEPEQD